MKYPLIYLLCMTVRCFAGTAVITGDLSAVRDGDSVVVFTSSYGDPYFMGYSHRYSALVQDHHFNIRIPVPIGPVYVDAIHLGSDDQGLRFHNYLLEAGDSINLGPGGLRSAKWVLQQRLDSLYLHATAGIDWGSPGAVKKYYEMADTTVIVQLQYLENIKKSLSTYAYQLLKANIYGLWLGKAGFFKNMDEDGYPIALDSLRYYRCGLDMLADSALLRDTLIRLSFLYANAVEAGYRLDSCIIPGKPFSVAAYYGFVKTHYTGPLEERLVVNALYKARDKPADTRALLADALQCVTSEDFRAILYSLQARVQGTKAPGFSLRGMDGRAHRLADYAGKVVLMDCWFTGCGNCVRVHPYIDSIARLFAKKDFVVLSVNVDRDKAWWLGSLKGGKYSSAGFVNLTTGGMDHPLLQHYSIDAYPALLVMDRRGVLLANPVDPRLDNGRDLVRLLQEAVKEPPR